MNYITDEAGAAHNRFYPAPTTDVTISTDTTPISNETVNFKVGAAGFKGIVGLDKNKISNARGDKIGSYWRERQNLMIESSPSLARVTALVETNGSASISININPDSYSNIPNLEQLFEITTGNSQYVVLAIDSRGNELYGYIRGISVSGTVYTLTVHNTLAGGTQNWLGSLANFDSSDATKVSFKIFSYESSIVWTTGTILTQEKFYDPSLSDFSILNDTLTTDGDYVVDYMKGRIFYRKATNGTSDTVSYSTKAQTTNASIDTSGLAQESGGNLAAAATSLAALDNAVAGNELQVDIVTAPETNKAATSSAKGSVSIPTTAGGTALIGANASRRYALIQNPSGVDIYVGTGTVTNTDIKVSPGGDYQWETQEAVKALSSSGTVTVNYIDLTN